MSRFDLSNAGDFSRITQQALGAVSGIVDGRDPSEWDILEGSYNNVIFHVFQSKVDWQGALSRVNDVAGRRKVKYQFPYKDGQTTDDLGRKPGSFEMEILLHGTRYMKGYRALMAEFDKPTPGVLVHPIRGKITCAVDDIQISSSNEQRKAILLKVVFIEHNFTVGNLRDLKDASVKSKLAQALEMFKKFDDMIKAVENATLFTRGVKNLINSLLNSFKTANGQALTALNTTFNGGGSSADIPALLPVNQGGTRNADGTIAEDNFVVVRSVSDPFNNIPVELLSETAQTAIAVSQLSKQITDLRVQAAVAIQAINDNGGALEFFDQILDIRQSIVLIQDVFEAGIASSNAQIIDYETPQVMSLREVAFANGIPVNRVEELDLLNPSLLSVNYIAKGTMLKVPVA